MRMDFNLGEPERICNIFLLCHALPKKITITILLHIPRYSAALSAWTSTKVNQKGYVTYSYNVMHDGIKKLSRCCYVYWSTQQLNVHGLQPGWTRKDMKCVPKMSRTTKKFTTTILLHIPKYSATVCAWTSTWVTEPERICNIFL